MKLVALLADKFTHHLDHLAPACFYLECPLLVDNEEVYNICKEYYPDVDVQLKTFNLTELANDYDTFLLSTKHASRELQLALSAHGNSNARFCYLPHGHSDKGLSNPNMLSITNQDIALLYGPHQQNRLKDIGTHETNQETLIIGNLRYQYYLAKKDFFKDKCKQLYQNAFGEKKPTLLYAPTWQDTEHGSSFKQFAAELVSNIPNTYNLWIKPHPFLERDLPADYYYLEGLAKESPSMALLEHIPFIYPILSMIDGYIGDHSAVNYDQLYFPSPTYFLTKTQTPIHRTGVCIHSIEELMSQLPKAHDEYQSEKKKIREFAFAKIDPHSIKHSLQSIVNGDGT